VNGIEKAQNNEGIMGFPKKTYDRLHNLPSLWGVSQDDIYYAVESGLLRVCVWLPMRFMERGTMRKGRFAYVEHEHKEGFVGVRPEDFHRIYNTGCAKLRIFRAIKQEGHILRMAYEPPQPAIAVRIHDLVVLEQDRIAFEQAYEITHKPVTAKSVEHAAKQLFSASADYHHIVLNGEEYHLGDIQARVVEQLHDAARSRTQWVHGKTLLFGANSRAIRMRDVFKSKNEWQKIIVSNGRGYYRLNLPEIALEPAASKAA
jgi:hypothetical protein